MSLRYVSGTVIRQAADLVICEITHEFSPLSVVIHGFVRGAFAFVLHGP